MKKSMSTPPPPRLGGSKTAREPGVMDQDRRSGSLTSRNDGAIGGLAFWRYRHVVLIICLGIILTLTFFNMVQQKDRSMVQRVFENDSFAYAAAIQKGIERNLEVLESIGGLFTASAVVERQDFRAFVRGPVSRQQEIQALSWNQLVKESDRASYEAVMQNDGSPGFQITERTAQGDMERAERRAEYVSVAYIVPLKGNEAAVGFDLASNPTRREALERSRDTGEMVATARITLVQETEEQFGILILKPVYKSGTPHETIEQRRENLTGFAVGVFRISDMVEAALRDSPEGGVNVHLYDETSPNDERLLYFRQEAETAASIGQDRPRPGDDFHLRVPLDIPGRQWALVFSPTQQLFATHETQHAWGVLVAGILVAALLVASLINMIHRSASIRQLAVEVSKANEELESEITERKWSEEEIRRLALAVATANDGIVIADLDGKISFTNKAVEQILGYGPGEMMGMEVWRLHPESTRDIEPRRIIVATLGDGHWSGEVVLQRKGGDEFPARLSTSLMQSEDGQPVGMVGIITDITEHKLAQEALQESEEQHRAVVDNVADAIAINVGTKRVFVNKAYLRLHGVDDMSQVLDTSIDKFILPGDRGFVSQRTLARQRGEPVPGVYEYRIQRPDGEVRTVQTSAVAIAYKGQQAALVVLRDITERKRTEEELYNSEARNLAFINAIPDPMYRFRKDGTLVDYIAANAKAESVPDAAWVGKSMRQVMPTKFVQLVRRHTEWTLRTGRTQTFEFQMKEPIPNGDLHDYEGRMVASGEDEVLTIVRDITERKKAEERMGEVSRLVALGELAAMAAHELNNPLTGVLGFAQLLDAQDLEPSAKEDVGHILNETQRAIKVVQNLLSLGRKHEKEKVPLDVATAVARVLSIKEYDLGVSNIEVETHFEYGPLYVMADPHRLAEVFLNIVTNAQQAMTDAHQGGQMLIRGTKGVDSVRISFTDNGPGIANDHLGTIFEPFFTSKEIGKGTGLGLSICRTLVQEQGGRIWVESKVKQGATFHVELPASKPR